MKTFLNLFFLALITLLFSCERKTEEKYGEINTIMVTNPQKALKLTRDLIKKNKNLSEKDRNKLALLEYKAEDKCGIPHNSDSLILRIYNYMSREGTPSEKLVVNYYMGRTYHTLKNYPQAIFYYNSAIDIAAESELSHNDSIVLSNIYSQFCEVNMNLGNSSIAHASIMKSLNIQKALNIDNLRIYQDVADSYYRNLGNIDSATYYYKECAVKIAGENSVKENELYISSQLEFFSETGNQKMAKWTFMLLNGIKNDSLKYHSLTSKACYYTYIERKEDSIIYYDRKAYQLCNDIRDKSIDARNLFMDFKHFTHNNDSALKYASLYITLTDSADNIELKEEMASAQSLQHAQELEFMRIKLHEGKMRLNEIISYGVAIVMFMIILMIVSFNIYNRHQRKYQEDYEKLKANKEEMEVEHHKLEKIMAADNKLRSESAKDVSAVVTHLNNIEYNPKEILTEELWNDVFLAVDKIYPDFRKYILSYYSTIENKDLILVYLVVLGKKQADVARLFKNSRSVVNRKFHRLDNRLGASISEVIDKYISSHLDTIEPLAHPSVESDNEE